ncbi:class I adenylate-forming enzyme family protein [Rhodococcus sp. IEGM 1379]|uniref:class I adenylate-forming enzyme family protein n=1 Tax=Rhodococcus sp. IEGM 1379 TaxID=3047086 RepID=UPI0024B783FA|nr:class I adenylate-forming enzyme family protein [Rhodococcus sp. IEGM 1379]MDI9914222.1 class I adenylate-forming enzyme family protein [Rhodococcus sp. IEGM 1379]
MSKVLGRIAFADKPESFSDISISEVVRHRAANTPDVVAFVTADRSCTWRDYDLTADRIAAALACIESVGGSGVAIYLPDTMAVHAALCGAYRAGRVAAGIGFRSGTREIAHLMIKADCRVLITTATVRGRSCYDVVDDLQRSGAQVLSVIVVDDDGAVEWGAADRTEVRRRVNSLESSDGTGVFTTSDTTLLNSTSGTTGLPKVVAHNEKKWIEFARLAMVGARITDVDVFCSAVPAPFGFGLWSAHFLPTLLGARTVVLEKFDVEVMIDLIERERVTVLCCVSTQFKMLLRSERVRTADLSSLRVLYTGGEAVPYSEALAFEERTGAKVLQFYGSNEAGAVSQTTLDDDHETRLKTCGHVIESMNVRILSDNDNGSESEPRRGQPAVHGPLESLGYWQDEDANAELYTADGWMLLGDIVDIDVAGRIRVVGRIADLIIRGGKNISAVDVEDLICAHPSVRAVSVVGVLDDVFGERVCAVVVTESGVELSMAMLSEWMRAQGITTEYIPEYVVLVDDLPTGPGGKVAKSEVRKLAVSRV